MLFNGHSSKAHRLQLKDLIHHSGHGLARVHSVILAKDWPESSSKDVYYIASRVCTGSRGQAAG